MKNLLVVFAIVICNMGFSQGVIVEPGTNIKVMAGTTMNIASGNLIVKSDTNGDASLIDYGTVVYGSGTAKVQRYLRKGKWHFISSPVTNAISGMFAGEYLKYYNEQTNAYVQITPTTTPIVPGKGYMHGTTGSGYFTKTFSGPTNTGDVTFNYTKYTNGWNLVGNPYPCVLDWDVVSSSLPSSLNAGVSLYDPLTNTYKYYITGGGAANTASKNIAMGQGFMIQATSAGSITFNNDMRTHGQTTFYKSIASEPLLVLKSTGNNITTQTALRFRDDATDDFDRLLDVQKIVESSPNIPVLYTKCQNSEMAINSIPLTTLNSDAIIPLYFKAGKSGSYQISASELQSIDNNVSIYLKDVSENYIQDIRQNPVYSFLYDTTEHTRNMLIYFKNTSGIADNESNDGIICYTNDNQLHVNFIDINPFMKGEVSEIEILDLTGRHVYSLKTNKANNIIELNNIPRAVYLVRAKLETKIYIKKILF